MASASDLLFFHAEAVRAATPWDRLIPAIRDGFISIHHAPDRHIHTLNVPGDRDATALLMPAWIEGEVYGVKLANIYPSNNERGDPAVNALYALFNGRTGMPLAVMNGSEITARRTAATSALAARYLARENAETLLLVGTGRLPPLLAEAHASVRPITRIVVWGRNPEKADSMAGQIGKRTGIKTASTRDLAAAAAEADIISCATISRTPLIEGDWLRPGTHLDLVGAFTPEMRETDAQAVRKSSVFIDTLGGAQAEAGDLIHAIAEGRFAWSDVVADMPSLCGGKHPGRTSGDEITLFKSVGAAIEDLVAARLVFDAR